MSWAAHRPAIAGADAGKASRSPAKRCWCGVSRAWATCCSSSRFIPLLATACSSRKAARLVWNSFPQMGDAAGPQPRRPMGVDYAGRRRRRTSAARSTMHFPLLSLPLAHSDIDAKRPSPPRSARILPSGRGSLGADWQHRGFAGDKRGCAVGLAWSGSAGHQRSHVPAAWAWERYATAFRRDATNVASLSRCNRVRRGGRIAAAQAALVCRIVGLARAKFASVRRHGRVSSSALDLVITVCTSRGAFERGARPARPGCCSTPIRTGSGCWSAPTARGTRAATLYRQPRFREWNPALEAVARDLSTLAGRQHTA